VRTALSVPVAGLCQGLDDRQREAHLTIYTAEFVSGHSQAVNMALCDD
jgi:hypothetical protein